MKYRYENIAHPNVIGCRATVTYEPSDEGVNCGIGQAGDESTWEFIPSHDGSAIRFSIFNPSDRRWSKPSPIVRPERFGPVPAGVSRADSQALFDWVRRFFEVWEARS